MFRKELGSFKAKMTAVLEPTDLVPNSVSLPRDLAGLAGVTPSTRQSGNTRIVAFRNREVADELRTTKR